MGRTYTYLIPLPLVNTHIMGGRFNGTETGASAPGLCWVVGGLGPTLMGRTHINSSEKTETCIVQVELNIVPQRRLQEDGMSCQTGSGHSKRRRLFSLQTGLYQHLNQK